jgi:NADH-quinone oxidoreductase subunit G
VASGALVDATRLSNSVASVGPAAADQTPAQTVPCVASIYQLDGLVRRATSLQLTSDARGARA